MSDKSAAEAAAADPTPAVKRKRAIKKNDVAPAAAVATTRPVPSHPLRAWVCTDNPVLFGGRPGLAVCARDEGAARARAISELERRGIPVKGKIGLDELTEGQVFFFQ